MDTWKLGTDPWTAVWRAEADNNAVAARSITLDTATRAFLLDYIKNPPK